MIKIENTEVIGWEHAIRGMRNPMNSWNKSDSDYFGWGTKEYSIGKDDHKLMMTLASAGSDHSKYRRMIIVYADITAPLYWWKEFDTYKVGTVANSCSTMHKIHENEFTLDDFSVEHLNCYGKEIIREVVSALNTCRSHFLETKDKTWWWQMIQLLPTSYNQRRTVMMNYEVLANIHNSRHNHKLDEWIEFCKWIEDLPYSEIIIK